MIAAEENIKTGKEWLPDFPEHWQLIRVKNLFTEIDKRSVSGKEDLLSVSQYTGVTLRKDAFEEGKEITNAKTLKGYKIVEQGDLVVNIMLAWNGCLGISPYYGITSPAYCVYRVKENYNPEYFGYLFSTALYKGEFRKRSTGIIESRLRLYTDAFFRIFCFVPPKKEQDEIVNLINSESAKITHFIQTKQRFIELLKEQRQSIIDEALDIEAKLIRLKFCVSKVGSGVTPKGGASVYQNSGVIFLRSQNIHNDNIRLDDVAFITDKIHSEMSSSQVKRGDVLLNITGASIGRCYWFNSDEEANVNQHVSIIRPVFEILDSEFLMYQIQSQRIQHLINTVQGASREGLTIHEIKNYPLLVPSTIEEQKRIVEHIKAETKTLDIAISKAEREIELIKEYREAMIAEAVTGKLVISG